MGRRTKISESVVSKICTAIKLGCTVQLAAGYAGIHVRTIYFWLQRGQEDKTGQFKDFYTRYKEAESIGAVNNLACINSAAKGGDWRAAAWLLERRHPESWSLKKDISIDVKKSDGADRVIDFLKQSRSISSELESENES